ncbi:fimbrial protein [Caballeronia insecticola]|uniref:fimbrial protein n=1 Tax=Caballeronia insecticola TaxID=758793 RepID=UPI00039B4869|nr:fimbrial protein [Caballeronia insecticola]
MFSQFASAATSGVITFQGALVADTCTVTTGTNNNFTVALPSVQTSTLASAGQIGGTTPFTIGLTGCSPSVPIRASFAAGSAGLAGDHMKNTGLAGNVELQLLNSSGTAIALSQSTAAAQGDTLQTTDATGAANLAYSVQYYAKGTTTAGSVLSNINYTIVYN